MLHTPLEIMKMDYTPPKNEVPPPLWMFLTPSLRMTNVVLQQLSKGRLSKETIVQGTVVQGAIVQGDSCPRRLLSKDDFCPRGLLSKETFFQGDSYINYCPRK